jgi:hypothetical protein
MDLRGDKTFYFFLAVGSRVMVLRPAGTIRWEAYPAPPGGSGEVGQWKVEASTHLDSSRRVVRSRRRQGFGEVPLEAAGEQAPPIKAVLPAVCVPQSR